MPRTTLKDRLSGRVIQGTKPGPIPYLSASEEDKLFQHVLTCAEIGYPKTKCQVIGIVRQAVQKERGPEAAISFTGKGWNRFVERWPKVCLRKGDALAIPRAKAITNSNIAQYYELQKKTLEEHYLMGYPSRIYNMDESGMPLDHKPPKVVARKGMKKVHCRTSGNKAQITVLACSNAAGSVIPPMVIFEGQRFNPEWSKGEVTDTLYGMSDKGWTDQELFYYWMTELFVKQIPPARPVMLLVDGHSSHYEPVTIRAASEQGVVVFCLPPHCTHVAQPLDVSFFRPLKVYWSEACHMFMQENPGCVVTKYQFSQFFSKAWYKAIQPQNLISSFAKTGIHPFNPDKISVPVYPPGANDESDEESSEEEYMDIFDNQEDDHDKPQPTSFSPQQIELFTTRYENGYDIYTDADYMTWLVENHPDFLCEENDLPQRSDPFRPFEDDPPLLGEGDKEGGNESTHDDDGQSGEALEGDMEIESTSDSNVAAGVSHHEGKESGDSISQSSTPVHQVIQRNPESSSKVPIPCNTSNPSTPGPPDTSSSASSSDSFSKSTRKPLSPISEFLTFPNRPLTPKSSKQKKSNGPRVLTSSIAIAMMEEKQKKKQEEEEAKEQRKKEREAKKLQREEEKKRKAEERLKKDAERKKKSEEREQEKKRKAEAERNRKAELKELRLAEKENRPQNKKKHLDDSTDGLQ